MKQGLEAVQNHATEFTQVYGYKVDVREEGGQIYVIIKEVDLPATIYNMPKTDVLFLTDHQYPLSAPDMFWVNKDLLLADGSEPKNADQLTTHLDGIVWRRFSWHSNNGNNNANTNGIIQHYELIVERWRREHQ